jgi:hypothetical protein
MPRITIKRQVIEEISFDHIDDIGTTDTEPFEAFCHKVENLAELLDCTFEQAERLILERL